MMFTHSSCSAVGLKIKEAESSAPQRACLLAEREFGGNGGPMRTSSQVVGEATMSNTWDHKGRKKMT